MKEMENIFGEMMNIIYDTGSARKDAIKIENGPTNGPNIKPKINIILTSPPPRDSFFRIALPTSITTYIKENKNIPDNRFLTVGISPYPTSDTIKKYRVITISNSSGIIKNFISDTITIINIVIIPRAISSSVENPNE